MKISIIVPFCNTPIKMISKLINQLNTLDRNLFEIIFINDGSKEEISSFVENNASEIKYTKLDLNQGVSHARNLGIEQATGDYLFFVDSDDLINLNILNILPTLNLKDLTIFTSDNFVDEANDDISELNLLDLDESLDSIYLNCKIKGIAMRSACGKLFKKEIIDKNNLKFDEELSFYEDAMFVSLYFNHVNSFQVYSNVVYHYRMNQNSYSKKFNKNYFLKYNIFYDKYKNAFSKNVYYLKALHFDAFNSVLISKVVKAFKKGHYCFATKTCKQRTIVESCKFLLENKLLTSRYKIKLASLIINGHNITAANKILFHQIFGSLKIRLGKIVRH